MYNTEERVPKRYNGRHSVNVLVYPRLLLDDVEDVRIMFFDYDADQWRSPDNEHNNFPADYYPYWTYIPVARQLAGRTIDGE